MTHLILEIMPRQASCIAVIVVVAAFQLLIIPASTAQTTGSEWKDNSASTTVQTPSPDTPEKVSALVAQLRSPDRTQRDQAADKLRQMQRTTGQQLLESAKQQVREVRAARKKYQDVAAKLAFAEQEKQVDKISDKAEVATATIRLLGELHVEAAIPFLLENINFAGQGMTSRSWNMPFQFPCLGALIRLGPPAADATLRGIEEESIARWCEQVLARMLGPQGAAGYLQDRIDTLKQQQKAFQPPVTAIPGKPPLTPISMRIERLEAVRTRILANAKEYAWLFANFKPNAP